MLHCVVHDQGSTAMLGPNNYVIRADIVPNYNQSILLTGELLVEVMKTNNISVHNLLFLICDGYRNCVYIHS